VVAQSKAAGATHRIFPCIDMTPRRASTPFLGRSRASARKSSVFLRGCKRSPEICDSARVSQVRPAQPRPAWILALAANGTPHKVAPHTELRGTRGTLLNSGHAGSREPYGPYSRRADPRA